MLALILAAVTGVCEKPLQLGDNDTPELRLQLYAQGACFKNEWPGVFFYNETTPRICKRWREIKREWGKVPTQIEMDNAIRSCRDMEAEQRRPSGRPVKIRLNADPDVMQALYDLWVI